MDQRELRELEYRCIQEEPAWCVASCPLHVDARTFAGHAARGEWTAARKALEKNMPFPGLLGRICDHPCEAACKRGEAGEPIAIGALESICVSTVDQQTRPLPLPQKETRAVIYGGGLAGMTAAWDLARKGHSVTLHTANDRPGRELLLRYGDTIPESELETALALLQRVQVEVVAYSTATLELDGLGTTVAFADRTEGEHFSVPGGDPDPATLVLFGRFCVGGGENSEGGFSPIRQAAEGRKAAVSMDRMLQNVSLTLQREKEGPYETRLYTSLLGVKELPREPMAYAGVGYTPEEGAREASRCLQCECMECVKGCVYLEHYKGYPKVYARQIYNNESIVKGHHQSNTMINSCMTCGQCTVICPNDFPMGELCATTRESMVARGKMPPSAHDFALEDMRFNQGEHFAMFRNPPGAVSSDMLFFPGCQLCGSNPKQVDSVYRWLADSREEPVGLMLGCCGAPGLWAGREDLFAEALDKLRDGWKAMGMPLIVVACATCYDMLREHAPELPVTSLWEVMSESETLPSPSQPGQLPSGPLALHDPCSSRHYEPLRTAARSVFTRMGVELAELVYGGEYTTCCGYGGLLYNANPPLAREVATRRSEQSVHDFAAYCAMCRDNLVSAGKRTLHLLDLVFPETTSEDPAGRPSPDYSRRHENRAQLKRSLLAEVWGEHPPDKEEYESIAIIHSPEVRKLMHDRHILQEDVRRTILWAETSGRKFENPVSGRILAYHKPVRVTYWVEYEHKNGACLIHNVYSHRMNIPGATP